MKKTILTILLTVCLSVVTVTGAGAQETITVDNSETVSTTTVQEETTTTSPTTTEEDTTTTQEEPSTTSAADESTTDSQEEPDTSAPDISEEDTTVPKEEPTTPQPDTPDEEPDEPETVMPEGVVHLNGKTIMIIGNSMIYYGNCVISGDAGKEDCGYFYQLIASNGEKAKVIDHTYPGLRLDEIYDNYLKKLNPSAFKNIDYVVMSEAAQKNKDLLGTCRRIMALFPEGTQFRFMCHPIMYDRGMKSLITGVETLRKNGIEVVDWGKMVYDIYTGAITVPGATLTFDRASFIKDNVGYFNGTASVSSGAAGDNKHPNPLSGYVAAQMLYSSITNRSAVFADYSYCDNSSIHKLFNISAFAASHYTGTVKTNFTQIFRSPKNMLGLQQLIDIYLEKEGKHPLSIDNAVNPGCTSAGLTEGYHCAVCGLIVKEQSIIPSKGGHRLSYQSAVEATCTKAGKTSGMNCSECGKVFLSQKNVPAVGHVEVADITAATKSKNGKKIVSCSVCKTEISRKKLYKIKSIALSSDVCDYNGKSRKPNVIVKDSKGNILKKDTDYTLTYSAGRKEMGTYSVKVKFRKCYSGEETLTFRVLPGATEKVKTKTYSDSAKITWKSVKGATGYRLYLYNPSKKKYEKLIDTKKTSYTVKNLKSNEIRKIKIKAYSVSSGKKYYASKTKLAYAVTTPSAVSLRSVWSSGASAVSLAWNATPYAEGYEIVYSTDKGFKSSKKVKVSEGNSKVIKKLKSGKTYYFKVRAYKVGDNNKFYGPYSEVKSVKVR